MITRFKRRRSIRLRNYDYAQPGAYFVTICTYHKECLFGWIEQEKMLLSDIGNIVEQEWVKSAEIRKEIEIGEYIVMPNHMHGIVWMIHPSNNAHDNHDNENMPFVGAYGHTPLRDEVEIQDHHKFQSPSKTLGAMIRGFKSSATKQINIYRNTPHAPVFQRGFYEHIIRSESDYQRIHTYILTNPVRWETNEYFQA